jgi:hypothetical protein
LVSKNISNGISICDIKPNVQSKMFDHKAIVLDFKAPPPKVTIPTISSKIINDACVALLVEISALETFLTYSAELTELVKAERLAVLGRCRKLLRDLGPDPGIADGGNLHAGAANEDREEKIQEIKNLLSAFVHNQIFNSELIIPADEFFETYVNNIRNDVISHQSYVTELKKRAKNDLIVRIEKLKKSYTDIDEITRLEQKLCNINEVEISYLMQKNKTFENINNERITPYFLKVIKGSKDLSSMNVIKDSNGNAFLTDLDRKEYIRNHFVKIYAKDPNEPESLENCIENFLGPDLLNHRVVRDSKLNEEEKTQLDQPLTLEELTSSLNGANSSSAPGIDGINTRFIKQYWNFFGTPLLRYAERCFENGTLTRSFRTAIFKLIPKKGDCTDINKWRPISLLSCLYKVISRAINNRLKLVINRFTSRAQKGFTSHRYIQEVLINVIETINYCKRHNVNAAIVSIDQSKAFDTISHKYCSEVFKFFNFGANFINMMETIGTGRTASILFEDGSFSREIELGRSRPQGDGPSPVQYNMGESILLLKIELDPQIASVFQHHLPPNFTMNFNPPKKLKPVENNYEEHLAKEKDRKTDKANAFADDTTVATLANVQSLGRLKAVLAEFSIFSG